MEQLPRFGKFALLLPVLAGCMTVPDDDGPAATAPARQEVPAATPGARPFPDALRRQSYDAPEWDGDAFAPPAARQAVVEPQPVAAAAPAGAATPVDLQFGAAPAAEVPAPPRTARPAYTPRPELAALEPILVRDQRPAPEPVRMASAEPSPPQMRGVTPVEREETTPPTDDFAGSTTSVMPETARVEPAAAGGYGLHLASYRDYRNVESGWGIFRERHPDVFSGLSARGVEVDVPGKGPFVRLLVGPFETPAAAKALCGELKSRDEYCMVMPFEGTPVG